MTKIKVWKRMTKKRIKELIVINIINKDSELYFYPEKENYIKVQSNKRGVISIYPKPYNTENKYNSIKKAVDYLYNRRVIRYF